MKLWLLSLSLLLSACATGESEARAGRLSVYWIAEDGAGVGCVMVSPPTAAMFEREPGFTSRPFEKD